MAGYKVGLVYHVAGVYGVRSETEVADSNAPRFLGVIAVVTLSIEVCLSADDLDRVLVRSDRSV
ncbi:hypothetical protein SDC9_168386 [bioreactor metagenome]|uniref:Uncharacterized protein n=1 Tax=bioreactor metagenome TaxID=1076179 RepID=A0A645G2B9_9ZZZZ